MEPLARTLILVGAILVALGLLLHLAPSVPLLGKLPGDLRIERPGFRLYLPITTCLLLSAAASLAFWLVGRLR